MAITFKTDPTTLASMLTENMASQLEHRIKAELMGKCESIVTKIARDMAQNLKTKIVAWEDSRSLRSPFGGATQVTLMIDGAKALDGGA